MTPEWVAAIAGVAATATALVALVITLVLYGKQSKSLEVTIKALNAELAARRRDELAAREEQARKVKIDWLGQSTLNAEGTAVVNHLNRHGLNPHLISGVEIQNKSNDPIQQVSVTSGESSALGWITGWDSELTQGSGMVPAEDGSRFYWSGDVAEGEVFVYFTDANGVRWRLHRRDGLSEATEQE